MADLDPTENPSDGSPMPEIESALPPVAARVMAFVFIIMGGIGGGVIGYYFAELQCDGDCGLIVGLSLLAGTIVGAIGVALIASMTLRSAGEWDTSMPWSGDA